VTHDKIFITLRQLRSCFYGAPPLTRGRVCLLYMLLVLASVDFLGCESWVSWPYFTLWDLRLPFRRLLRLAGSHGCDDSLTNELSFINRGQPKKEHHTEEFVCFHPLLWNVCQFWVTVWILAAYSLLWNMLLASRCLAMNYSVTILLKQGRWVELNMLYEMVNCKVRTTFQLANWKRWFRMRRQGRMKG
jgi:hypothetical protein